MATRRLQVQVSMCPAEWKQCQRLLQAFQREYGWSRVKGKPNRSAIINHLIREALKRGESEGWVEAEQPRALSV